MTETATFTGPVFTPDDAGYQQEIAGFQTAYTHRPALVAGAVHTEDVRAAVEYAARHRVPLAVQATGHGLSVAIDGGVLVTTGRMNAITVDPDKRTARVGAGVRAGALVEAAAAHGLAPLNGSSPSVGVVGYVLGGGLGLLGREFGYAADHVRSIELVTADGRVRTIGPADELFTAVLGTGGNFGVVTALELDLVPVTEIFGGQLMFDTPLVDTVLDTWRQWSATVPEEITSTVAVLTFPDIPPVPQPLRGRHVASIRVATTLPAEAAERLIAPLRAIGDRLRDDLRTMPYIESHTVHSDPDFPHAYAATNALLADLTPEALAALRTQTAPGGPVDAVVDIRHLGGALRRGTASVGHRDAEYIVRVITDAGAGDAAPEALDTVRKALAPWTIGHSLNFLYGAGAAAGPEQTAAGYPRADFDRLRALKTKYDPHGMFRANRTIPGA
ncbi:FAD-binding oxidoreductase [Nocardia coubleae]|uniref:FAD-binding oxidoreductase n=1 Tax=Nocardia coubleae TaxID=356147 RepID=UPI0008314889|nr:FAD-binding oxidoreductase [Nocardia coubleae]